MGAKRSCCRAVVLLQKVKDLATTACPRRRVLWRMPRRRQAVGRTAPGPAARVGQCPGSVRREPKLGLGWALPGERPFPHRCSASSSWCSSCSRSNLATQCSRCGGRGSLRGLRIDLGRSRHPDICFTCASHAARALPADLGRLLPSATGPIDHCRWQAVSHRSSVPVTSRT